MNADKILAIKYPESLFSEGVLPTIHKEYRALAKKWHPDVCKNGDKVFAHITSLHLQAVEKVANGKAWEIPGQLLFTTVHDKRYKVNYRCKFPFELGTTYVGNTVIAFVIDIKHKRLAKRFEKRIKGLKFASDSMKEEFRRYLPPTPLILETKDSHVVVIKKTKDVIPLRGYYEYVKHNVPPRHVGWIMNSIFNIMCYLDYTGICHHNISLDTIYISAEFHSGLLLGGWWYTIPKGKQIVTIPRDTFRHLPPKVRKEKQATLHTDIECLKSIGRKMMGGKMSKKKHPELIPIINRLLLPAKPKPIDEWRLWRSALEETFGKPKFIKLDINLDDIHNMY